MVLMRERGGQYPASVSGRAAQFMPVSRGRTDRRRAIGLLAGGATLMAGVVSGGTRTAAQAQPDQRGIEGLWLAEFLPLNPPPDRPPTRVLLMFAMGGGLVAQVNAASRNDDGTINYLTPGVGAWVRSGERELTFNYIYDRIVQNFARTTTATVWLSVALDDTGTAWSGIWKRRDVDTDGAVTLNVEGTVQGKRRAVDPL